MTIRAVGMLRFAGLTALFLGCCALLGCDRRHEPSTWLRTYGGTLGDDGYSVEQTSDGGYVIAGRTGSYGAGRYDVWLIKTDADGDTIWSKVFGGPDYDCGESVQQAHDGGYVVVGFTFSFGTGDRDVWFIKTDANGDTVCTRTFGGIRADQGNAVRQTQDGGYVITGSTDSYGAGGLDVWLIKTDASGDTVWTKTLGGTNGEEGHSVQQTKDGGYIVTGETYSYGAGGQDLLLMKTDANGDLAWTKVYGGADNESGQSVQLTQDDGYIVTGYTLSRGAGGADVWLIKTDANGDTVWTRTFGGAENELGYSVQQTHDGGYIIAGLTDSYGAGGEDVWLIRVDANGDSVWTRTFGGAAWDRGNSVQQTRDDGYVISGTTDSYGAGDWDTWLIKTDADGRVDDSLAP